MMNHPFGMRLADRDRFPDPDRQERIWHIIFQHGAENVSSYHLVDDMCELCRPH